MLPGGGAVFTSVRDTENSFDEALYLRVTERAFARPESRHLTLLSPCEGYSVATSHLTFRCRLGFRGTLLHVPCESPRITHTRALPFHTAVRRMSVTPKPTCLDVPALGRHPRTVILLFTLTARRRLPGHGCHTALPVLRLVLCLSASDHRSGPVLTRSASRATTIAVLHGI